MLVEQAPAQRALEQFEPLVSLDQRRFGGAWPDRRPACLDLAKALGDHLIVLTVRAPVQRQADPHCGIVVGGEKQAVAPEILKTQPVAAQCRQQRSKAALPEQLAGQDVMALHAGVVVGRAAAIDRAERKSLALR